MNVISFTPVRVEPQILRMHLQTLERQAFKESWFYDDNTDPNSSALLYGRQLLPKLDLPEGKYRRAADTHEWDAGAITRITNIKNFAIERFLETDAQALFLVDSDLLLPHGLLEHLWQAEQAVICAVFYTKWSQTKPTSSPNVWDVNPIKYTQGFERFRKPGHYRVGGMGACTLVRREVLERGANFAPIFGLDMWGEDRAFCVRCSVLGYELIACSHLQPFHVYRRSEVNAGLRWLRS